MMILPELILLTAASVLSPHQPLLSSADIRVFAATPIAAAVAPQGAAVTSQGQGRHRHRMHNPQQQGGGGGVGGGTPEPGSYLLLGGVLLAYGMFRASGKPSIV
ncbi:MAG: hypothetical protein ACI9SE_002758 [Neolewinella sp.]|jgi:hypothetical protein